MGILVITWNFPPYRGGIENLMANLCQGLRRKYRLLVIAPYARAVAKGGNGVFRPAWPGLVPFFLYAFCCGVLLLWRDREIKVIIGGSAGVLPVIVLLARILRRKAFVHVHGLDLLYPGLLYRALFLRWLRRVDRVIANSHYTASLAVREEAAEEALSVIPPSVSCGDPVPVGGEELKREMGLGGRKLLLYVGRLARRKGVKEFLQTAFSRILAEVSEVCFLIVGENPTHSLLHRDSDVKGELRELVRDLRLEDHVRFLGEVSDADLTKIYRACDLMVLPALSVKDDVEGFGMVILEAAAAGKPCVATRVGGIPEAIEDGVSGILVSPGDDRAMVDAVVNLLRDHERRLTMGELARRRVSEKFSLEPVLARYEELIRSSI